MLFGKNQKICDYCVIILGMRDSFFCRVDFVFQTNSRFEKLLVTKSQIVGFFPDLLRSSVFLGIQRTMTLFFIVSRRFVENLVIYGFESLS